MGIFRHADSPYWWYRVQLAGRVVTGSTNTSDKRLAERICLEKTHQLAEDAHLPSPDAASGAPRSSSWDTTRRPKEVAR